MLDRELVTKLESLHVKMQALTGDALVKAQTEFNEVNAELERINVVAQREAQVASAAERSDAEVWKVFGKLVRGEQVDDRGRAALAIREESLKDKIGDESNVKPADRAFRIPGSAIDYLTGAVRAPLGLITADMGVLIPPVPKAPLMMLPLPTTPLFDKASKVNALNGIALPFLVQTPNDPYAGVGITVGTGEGEKKHVVSKAKMAQKVIRTQEYEGYIVLTDLLLRRTPEYESVISMLMRGALGYQVDADILTALQANASVRQIARAAGGAVSWADLVNLEGAIPYWWNLSAEYGMAQGVQTFLKGTLAATTGVTMYTQTTAQPMYTTLNGHQFFLDGFPALGNTGDVYFGNFGNVFVGVGQDIVMRRTSEGFILVRQNSTMFTILAHLGIGIPVGRTFARLGASTTSSSTTTPTSTTSSPSSTTSSL